MREKTIEAKLVKAVKSMGGIALKISSTNYDGMPDRLVLLTDGKLAFIELKAPGKTVTIVFDMGLAADEKLIVMTYIENPNARTSEGTWVPVESVVNNGDGTLTVVFEDICPVAFVTELGNAAPTGDAARNQLGIFIGLMVVSAAAIVVILCLKGKKH